MAKSRMTGVIGHQGDFDPRTMDKEMIETLRPKKKPSFGNVKSGGSSTAKKAKKKTGR